MNPHLAERLQGIQSKLKSGFEMGIPMSSDSQGTERHIFIADFLQATLPTTYRFGTGDITDNFGNQSGQQDVVIENSFCPSLQGMKDSPRMYVAEGVTAVVEVKSDLSKNWKRIQNQAASVAKLTRAFPEPPPQASGGGMVMMGLNGVSAGTPPPRKIPYFVFGYRGWADQNTLAEKFLEDENISGVLVLDPCVAMLRRPNHMSPQVMPVSIFGVPGVEAMWAFIGVLHYYSNLMTLNAEAPIWTFNYLGGTRLLEYVHAELTTTQSGT